MGLSYLCKYYHSGSVVCRAPMCQYVLLTLSGHAPDESVEGGSPPRTGASELLVLIYNAPVGAQLDLGQWNKRVSQWHQCLHHSGTVDHAI